MATTKRERQKAARRLKMEAMQRRAKRRQNTRRGIIIAIVAVLIGGTGVLLFAGKSPTTTTTTTPTTTVATTTTTTVAKPVSFSPVTDPSPAGTSGQGADAGRAAWCSSDQGGARELDHRHRNRRGSRRQIYGAVRPRRLLVAQGAADVVDHESFTDTLLPGDLISGWVYGNGGYEGRWSTRVDPAARRCVRRNPPFRYTDE